MGRLSTVKTSLVSKVIYKPNGSPIKIAKTFWGKFDKLILMLIYNMRGKNYKEDTQE
jgi:hypothetical protein